MAGYIARRGSALEGVNVLELGSGTGLVGLVAGHLGARVCITDQAYVFLQIVVSDIRWLIVISKNLLFFFYPADPKKAISFLSWSAISCSTDWNLT